jgi:ribosome-binding factor A
MATRRQEKVARVIKEAVSDAIANRLSDPRIECFVSVTRVETTPDLRNADVYLSVFGRDETAQKKTFAAIEHARSRIQSLLAGRMQSRYCPVLRFLMDEKFKKTLETMNIIDEAVKGLDIEGAEEQTEDEEDERCDSEEGGEV